MIRMLTLEQTVTPHDKIDDDDGHYIVTEDMPIGDRCECLSGSESLLHELSADYSQTKSTDSWARALLAKL